MLSLTLYKDKNQIVIDLPNGEVIRIVLFASTSWKQAKLGIDAPKNYNIKREDQKRGSNGSKA